MQFVAKYPSYIQFFHKGLYLFFSLKQTFEKASFLFIESLSFLIQTLQSIQTELPYLKVYPFPLKDVYTSRKPTYKILTPETPLLYSKTGVYKDMHYFFLFMLKNIDCGYSFEPPRRGGSNEYPKSIF